MATPVPPSPAIVTAANNAVAVASIAYQQEVTTFTRVLGWAHGHGLTIAELCEASGFDEAFITRLLEEAD